MKIRKKILWYLIVIWLWFGAFAPSIWNNAYAAVTDAEINQTNKESTTTVEETLNELWALIDIWLKLIYIVIWPMLFLAGIALDNSMVYWSFFHMDAPLWFFWNMTKNFANFTLGFIVLFSILRWIFLSFWDKKDARSPMEIIRNTLIAWVLIQASWFILAAIIDISTIATYAVWWMPMSLLNEKAIEWSNKQILQTESHLELNNVTKLMEEDFRVWYKVQLTWADWKPTEIWISPCLIKKLWTDTYIVGRKYWNEEFNHTKSSEKLAEALRISNTDWFPLRNICVFNNQVYFFNEFPRLANITDKKEYETNLSTTLNHIWKYTTQLESCKLIINLETKETTNTKNCKDNLDEIKWILNEAVKNDDNEKIKAYWTWLTNWFLNNQNLTIPNDVLEQNYWSTKWTTRVGQTLAPTVSQIIKKSQWFVWPFVTIYASIMDFANLSDSNSSNASIGKNLWTTIIKVAVAAGLVFPLIALAVVLFIRIWLLRVVIAASPIFILANVFEKSLKIKLWDHFTISNILKAIFAPVITVFALSISVIFMTTLDNALSRDNIDKIKIIWELGWEIQDKDWETYLTIAWFTIVYPKVVDTYAGATWDWFSWMLLSFSGIWIMWFILFAAIKATWTIWKVWETIKNFWENVFKTAPIVPIPGFDKKVWFWTIWDTINSDTGTKMRENKIDYEWQKTTMQTALEDKFSTAKTDYGRDNSFTESEIKFVDTAIKTNDSDKIVEALKDKWFVDRNLSWNDLSARIESLYSESKEFKELAKTNKNNEWIQKLLWEGFIEKWEAIEKANEIIWETYENIDTLKTKLNTMANKELLKGFEKQKKIWEKTYRITLDTNNQFVTEEKTSS